MIGRTDYADRPVRLNSETGSDPARSTEVLSPKRGKSTGESFRLRGARVSPAATEPMRLVFSLVRAAERNDSVRLAPLALTTYSVEDSRQPTRSDGSSPVQIEVPFGMPRYINARALKELVGTGRHDVLFRKAGTRWEIVRDSLEIDLRDMSQIFRIGTIQIYS